MIQQNVPPRDCLPVGVAGRILLVQRPGLLIAADDFKIWRDGVTFRVAILLRNHGRRLRLAYTPFHVPDQELVDFSVLVAPLGQDLGFISSQASHDARSLGGYKLEPLRSGSVYADQATQPDTSESVWWLSPLPTTELRIGVRCDALGVDHSEGAIDASNFRGLAAEVVTLGD